MTQRDNVAEVLALGELAIAQALLDAQLKALKKQFKDKPAKLTPLLRRRAKRGDRRVSGRPQRDAHRRKTRSARARTRRRSLRNRRAQERVREQRGLDVPDYTARAEICEARGDWDGCLAEWRQAVVTAVASS